MRIITIILVIIIMIYIYAGLLLDDAADGKFSISKAERPRIEQVRFSLSLFPSPPPTPPPLTLTCARSLALSFSVTLSSLLSHQSHGTSHTY